MFTRLQTDSVLRVPSSTDICAIDHDSFTAYLVVGSILVIVRFCTAVAHLFVWYARERRLVAQLHGQQRQARSKRLPLVPLVSFMFSIIFAILFSLTATNIINTTNGYSFFVFAIWTVNNGMMQYSFFRRLLRLSRSYARLLPTEVQVRTQGLDRVLVILLFMFKTLYVLTTLLFIIAGCVVDGRKPIMMSAFVVGLLSQTCLLIMVAHQTNRVILEIEILRSKDELEGGADVSGTVGAIHRIRVHQRVLLLSLLLVHFPMAAGIANEVTWWVLLVMECVDTFAMLGNIWLDLIRSCCKPPKSVGTGEEVPSSNIMSAASFTKGAGGGRPSMVDLATSGGGGGGGESA